jgi:predicted TIM-barrel fold metal-dependent hydrolase
MADAAAGNKEAARIVARLPGLLQWVIVHPLQPETYDQARRMLKRPGCVGIKIHPEEHCYSIRKHGRALFEFAAEQCAVVLTHTGEKNSWPIDFIPFANDFPEMRLILAHLGNSALPTGQPDHQVRAIQASKHGNVYTDTSSMRSIFPRLIEWAVKEVGADRILFGTDTPLYFPWMQRVRIDYAAIAAREKRMILRDNAARLLAGKIPK